jgi:hypothetical protein
MPTLIDSLVVALGLDSSKFEDEAARLENAERKAKDAAQRRGRELEAGQRRQTEGFAKLTKATLAYASAFLGINSVTSFVERVITGDAAVGRLSRRIGESTEEISAWQGVLRGAGGSAEDAASDLSLLRNAYEDIRLTGQSQLIPYLNLLGITLKDLDDPSGALLKVADAFEKMDPTQAAALGRQMGFSPAMISTLQRGRAATEELLNAQYRLGVTTKQSAADAEELQRQQAELVTLLAGWAREINKTLVPALSSLNTWLKEVGQDETFRTSMSAAKAVVDTLFIAVRNGVGLAVSLLRALARLLSGDFSGAWKTAEDAARKAMDGVVATLKRGRDAAVLFWNAIRGTEGGTAPAAGQPQTGNAAPAGAGGSERFGHIVKFWTDRGYAPHVARGIAAGIYAESNGDPKALNRAGGGDGAYGIGQWRGARQRKLFEKYPNPTLLQQLEYMAWEMNGGNGERGAPIRGAGSEREALSAYVHGFMRPGAEGAAGDMRRGQAALQRYQPGKTPINYSTTVGSMNVYTQATDARGIASGISRELATAVPQANLGLA